ncbi:MAG TPA: DUF2254 domain-containing protein [Bryobacteraceae bacterium]|nr:DUF2254 domain-containing protein [Bryobacteraceae bacterium]
MGKRLPFWLRRAMYNLRGGFLLRPLIIALTLGFAGALLAWLDETFPALGELVPKALFPSHSDPQVAQVILSGIASSIMTVVSIVFAILLMTLTLASMQFSPRIIVSFSKDRVTQWTLGIFLGTFCYCMAALPTARSLPQVFVPVVTVFGAMLLALACVAWLLYFIHHVSQAISVSHIVDRIATETEGIIDDVMPQPRSTHRSFENLPREVETWNVPLLSEESGYIRFIDTGLLVTLAKRHHVKIRAVRRVGHFVPAGTPLVLVYKANRLSAESLNEILGAFDLGPSRTLQQDVEFGILQIVDVALKAISPAVNDPTTAVSCVDQLSRILIRVASRETPASILYDPPGIPRVMIPWIGFEGLLKSAFQQIRLYSKSDVAVSLRMLRALSDISWTSREPAFRGVLYAEGIRIVEGCAEKLGEQELLPMRARLSELEKLAAADVETQ